MAQRGQDPLNSVLMSAAICGVMMMFQKPASKGGVNPVAAMGGVWTLRGAAVPPPAAGPGGGGMGVAGALNCSAPANATHRVCDVYVEAEGGGRRESGHVSVVAAGESAERGSGAITVALNGGAGERSWQLKLDVQSVFPTLRLLSSGAVTSPAAEWEPRRGQLLLHREESFTLTVAPARGAGAAAAEGSLALVGQRVQRAAQDSGGSLWKVLPFAAGLFIIVTNKFRMWRKRTAPGLGKVESGVAVGGPMPGIG